MVKKKEKISSPSANIIEWSIYCGNGHFCESLQFLIFDLEKNWNFLRTVENLFRFQKNNSQVGIWTKYSFAFSIVIKI